MGRTWLVLTGVLCLAVAIAGCGTPAAEPTPEAAPPTEEAPPPEPEAPVAEEPTEEPPPEALDHAELTIANFSFRPRTVTVLVGATVVWTHEDSAPHTVTSDDGIFDGGTMAEGGSFQFTFESPGTYAYHCDIHPRMTGTIEVIEAGQASVGSTAASASGGDYYSD